MGTTLLLKTKHGIADTKPIILEALKDHSDFSYARFLKFESECKKFEKKYKMDSEFFLKFIIIEIHIVVILENGFRCYLI